MTDWEDGERYAPVTIVLTNLEFREIVQLTAALAFWRDHREDAERELFEFFWDVGPMSDDELVELAERLTASVSADVRRNLQN